MTDTGEPETVIQKGGDLSGKGGEQGTDDKDARVTKLEETIRNLQSERDKARSDASKQTEMLAELKDIAKSQANREPGESAKQQNDRINDMVNEIAEAMREDEAKGARKLLEMMSLYSSDSESRAAKAFQAELMAIRESNKAEMDAMRAKLEDFDPEWQAVKEKAKEVAERLGLDLSDSRQREIAIKQARTEVGTQHATGRHALPGGYESTRVLGRDDGGDISPEVEALLAGTAVGKLSAEEKKALARKRQR